MITDQLYANSNILFQECLRGRQGAPTPPVAYNDLCFPKTSNYGSMRKQGRCDILTRKNIKQIDDIIREHDLAQQQQQNCQFNAEYEYA